ncbi:MAG: DUF975 family protein [Candidatus Omnitrophica bacterium]|nr:DUF975 family protein [Candidatus Omnitrophota bacterium]
MAKKFSINEAFKFGWITVKKNGGFFVTITFIVVMINFAPKLISDALKEDFLLLPLGISLIGSTLSFIVSMGLIRIVLKSYDNELPKFSDLFSPAPLFFKYLAASFLYGLICFAGTLLLIIPGIIWAIQFSFYGYLVVDREMRPVAALKKSSVLTKGVKWNLVIFAIVFIGINILGALFFLIGLLISVPTTMLAAGFVYRKLLEDSEAAQAEKTEDEKAQSKGDRGQVSIPQ